MPGPVVYLDSSACIKRYVLEEGSEEARKAYIRAYSGEVTLSMSIWNVGEVLGALDRALRRGRLDASAHSTARSRFLSETLRMWRLGALSLVPVKSSLLAESWRILERRHLYVADALQISTAKHVRAEVLLTGDSRLAEAAEAEGVPSRVLG